MRTSLADEVHGIAQVLVQLGFVPREELTQIVNRLPDPCLSSADDFLLYLVRLGWLSAFQASRFREGMGRRLVIGSYDLLAPLGQGGSGLVYLARNRRTDGPVALKILPPSRYRHDERQLTRFQREMAINARLHHPHLTSCLESGQARDIYYLAMEYVPGPTLRQKVLAGGPLSAQLAARLFIEVADALDYIHQAGLIHRDLKPGNIIVTPHQHAKLLDLGFALVTGESIPEDRRIIGGRGYVVGTMDFIAPEQIADPTRVDGRADLYSLGCSMYFALTGRVPFPGGSSHDKIRRHRQQSPPPVRSLNPHIPAGFAELIERLMAKQPESRPGTAQDVRRMLLPWIGDDLPLPLDVKPPPRRLRVPLDWEAMTASQQPASS
jgi:serine/threonine protein kinase